jgi:hypothetical protein
LCAFITFARAYWKRPMQNLRGASSAIAARKRDHESIAPAISSLSGLGLKSGRFERTRGGDVMVA